MDLNMITSRTFFAQFTTFFDTLTNWVFVVSYTLELSVVFKSRIARIRQVLVLYIGNVLYQ